jgi:hypothetical protein
MMPLAHDMIGLYFAVGRINHLPPTGSAEALLGTNPIGVALRARRRLPQPRRLWPRYRRFPKEPRDRHQPRTIGLCGLGRGVLSGRPVQSEHGRGGAGDPGSLTPAGRRARLAPRRAEHTKRFDRLAHGVPIPSTLPQNLEALAQDLGIALLP